jgi:hypothetical protein
VNPQRANQQNKKRWKSTHLRPASSPPGEPCVWKISLAIDRSACTTRPSSRSPRAQAAHGVVTFHYLFSTHPPARGGKLISLSLYNASFFLFSRAWTYGINAPIVYLQKNTLAFCLPICLAYPFLFPLSSYISCI